MVITENHSVINGWLISFYSKTLIGSWQPVDFFKNNPEGTASKKHRIAPVP